MKKLPKQILAPVIIAGITVGFLVSAYRFVSGKVKEPGLHPAASSIQSDAPEPPLNSELAAQDKQVEH